MKTATRHTALRAWAVVGLFGGLSALAGAQEGPESTERALQDLLEDHPEARVEFSRGESPRARSVFGTPMTRAERPEDAAAEFLARYGAAFVDGRAEFELVESFGRLKGGRVLHYRQTIEGVPVDGSVVRVFVHEDGEALPAVAYASGHFARPPVLGLPEPVVTAGEALVIAQMHPAGQLLDEWTEPELVATTTSGVLSDGEARLAWHVDGSQFPSESWGFWIDAVSGEVFRATEADAHFSDPTPQATVSGQVTAGATPGTEPDKPTGHPCGANLPVVEALPDLTVQLVDSAGTTILDSTTTTEVGNYQFFGTIPSGAQVRFGWNGPYWSFWQQVRLPDLTCLNPVVPLTTDRSVAPPLPVTIDEDLNPSPYMGVDTAKANVVIGITSARTFLLDRLPTTQYQTLFSPVNVLVDSCAQDCTAVYRELGPSQDPWLIFGGTQGDCIIRPSYSTIVSHEYAHYVLIDMIGIPYSPPHEPFSEGFADALSMFAWDVTVYGEDWEPDCSTLREPLSTLPSPAFDCTYVERYDKSLLLSALWLDLAADPASGGLGKTSARQLFVDWMLLTAGGIDDGPALCPTRDMAAGPATLIEVLTADDDDGALNNGTPNSSEICAIFASRGITSGSSPCGSPFTGGQCVVDLDRSGVVDVHDYLIFIGWLHAGDLLADWDGNGAVTILDAIAFANDFEEGC